MSQPDSALDGLALVAVSLVGNAEGQAAILGASDDAGHWRKVACVLVGRLEHNGETDIVGWLRQRVLDGEIDLTG